MPARRWHAAAGTEMRAFKGRMTDAQLDAPVERVRSLRAVAAGAVR